MADYVIMPKADYVAACDKIRERTGKTDLIKSGELATEIDSITGGGGESSELVKYVTFIGADGAELYKMPVLNGDDCKDPYTHGDITTPTKESTVAATFTYSGWSLTDGGSADSTALQNVTEDRAVYAAFTSSPVYYTIRFYDDDGTTLLHSEEYAYGTTPSYTPTKDGNTFIEWNPSITAVTGDADYAAVWENKPDFATCSWDTVMQYANAGAAANVFSVGDIRAIPVATPIGTTINAEFVIAGFNHDDLADGSGKAGITLISRAAFGAGTLWGGTTVCTAPSADNGAWAGCSIRTFVNDVHFNCLPAEVQSSIKAVKKITTSADTSYSLEETIDKIWIPSSTELNVKDVNIKNRYTQGTTYQVYVDYPDFKACTGQYRKDSYDYELCPTKQHMLRSPYPYSSASNVIQMQGTTWKSVVAVQWPACIGFSI